MKKPKSPSTAPALLRQKAEERVAGKPSKTGLSLTENETRKLIYELEVHQIELELQNQELMVANSLAQEANLKYIELFDFAPIGYFILSREGEILALNLCGSQMLGKGRAQIQQSRFGFFVSDETKPVFNLFLENIFLNKTKESCELVLSLDGRLSIHVHLSGNINSTDGNSLVTMVEITRLKQTEEALRKSERFLKYTQIITRLGNYSIDLLTGTWQSSEVLDILLGIVPGFDNSLEGWVSIVHPEWKQIMLDYFQDKIKGIKSDFDKEYKIIRQNDREERWVHSIGRIEYDVYNQPVRLIGTISDITSRKQAEAALSQSQALLFASLEGQKDTILFSIDREYRYLYFNQAHKEAMKYAYDALIEPGENILHYITSPADREAAETDYNRALRGESHSNIHEYGNKKKDWFESFFNPIVNAKNEIIGATGLARNITERKLSQDALQESESRFRNLLQDVQSISVQGYSPDGTTQYWNQASERLYGYSAQEAVGHKLLELIIPPEILSDVDQAIRYMADSGQAIPATEMLLKHKDGSRVPVFSSHTIIQVPGKEQELFCIDIDLSELKKTEKALRTSEAKFRQLYESIMDAIVTIDLDGKILSANTVFQKMLGYTMDEMTSLNFRDLTPVKWLNLEVDKYLKQVLRRGYSDTYEKEFRRKDGSLVPVEMRGFVIKNDKGDADYIWAIVRDITERKLNEKTLLESKIRLSKSQEIAHLGSWELDLSTGLFLWSDEVYRILGLFHQEFAGTYTEYLELVHPDDRALLEARYLESVHENKDGFSFEHRIVRKHTGEVRMVLEKCRHIRDASGKIVRSLGMVHDITEQKKAQDEIRKSEGQFRLLFEANSDGITVFRLNPTGPPSEIIDMNENAAKMLGYSKAEMQLIPPQALEIGLTAEKSEKRIRDIQSKGFSVFETNLRHKDGHDIHVEIKVMAVIYNNQAALMNIVRDITERKIIMDQLQEYAGALSRQNAEKDKFFSIIAHDLRSPFNVLLGFTQLLEEELSSFTMDEIQKFATNMRKSADKLFLLLENLLEWSLIQRGMTSFKPELFRLAEAVSSSVDMVRNAADKKHIRFSMDIPEEMIITADTQMFESLIRNLVFNAIKFTPQGGKITIAATQQTDGCIKISITDTGIGMDQNILDNLFHLDGQIHRNGTEGEPSTGLGLIICRDFIQKHGGKIWAESKENCGSTFFFTIPCRVDQNHRRGNKIATAPPPKQTPKLKILIAEDDETSEVLLSIAIKPFSRQILIVGSGSEAVHTCRNNPDLDLVLMDIKMPGMDGLEATRQIRDFNKEVVIIAQTAFVYSDDREEALAAGCTDFIAKPFDILSLRELLNKHFTA